MNIKKILVSILVGSVVAIAGLSALGNYATMNPDSMVGATIRKLPGGGAGTWGAITGTLADQTDLQTALDAKAVKALSNLASVAINTSLISDTDNTDDLGSASIEWKDIYIDGTAYIDALDFNGVAITPTGTELNYVDGVTSAIQTQLDAKLSANQTITLSGDVSGSGATAITTTIGDNKILEPMLKAVDAPADEECLTYESTVGDFEWQSCAGAAAAPTDADYLVGTANGDLSAEIVVGTSPGGELGGTWASPTLDDSVAVTSWNLTTPIITTSVDVGSAGVRISDDGDGAITFLSLGNGSGGLEDLTLNLDDISNVGTFSSSTSLATLNFSSIALQESGINVLNNDEIDASSELLAIMDDETGTGVLTFATAPTFTTSITVNGTDPADAGAIRLNNAENIAWEAAPAGTDMTLGVDSSEILQYSGVFNATSMTEGGIAVLNNDEIDASSELATIMDDETGAGVLMFNDSPTFADDFDLAAAGVRMTGADGVLTILGLGNGNDENLTFDFDNGTANQVDIASGTSVSQINWTGTFQPAALQIDSATTGVNLDTDGDGMLILAGTGNGNDEDIRFNMDDGIGGANSIEITSGTGATDIDFALNLRLEENTSLRLDPAGSADGKYSGTTVVGTGGATIAFGDLVTLDKDDSRWELVDISVAAAATGDARGILGIAVTSSSDGASITVLLHGIVRADANFPTLTIGAPVYASTTGDIVVTQPTTTDHVIRVIGHGLTGDELYFDPDNAYITHT